MRNLGKAGGAAAMIMTLLGSAPPKASAGFVRRVQYVGTLSVLTYNVKGLPWPVAVGRGAAIQEIGARLRRLRADGKAPHVLLLQEAFTADAKAIGAAAGYRYVAMGPTSDQLPSNSTGIGAGNWWRGETEGKFVGSGLEIASDFPIIAVQRLAFGQHTCAGYDCLANKGALLVRIRVPGVNVPIDVLDTHLNSRHASGVSDGRADRAYAMQIMELERFIRGAHDRRAPLVTGEDFNVGRASSRRTALAVALAGSVGNDGPLRDVLHDALARGIDLPRDARVSMERAKDLQFVSAGAGREIRLSAIHVPFGRESDGSMLSDHIGYVADYRMHAPTRAARS